MAQILPIFSSKVSDSYKLPILEWNEKQATHSLVEINAYEASEKLYAALDAALQHRTKTEAELMVSQHVVMRLTD